LLTGAHHLQSEQDLYKEQGGMAVAWVFPGQGSQVVGMGRELYEHVPAAREVFDQVDSVLGLSLAQICFEGPETALTATENAQPAILAVSVALLRTIAALAPDEQVTQPAMVAGHSLGEYSALVAARALDLVTAARLVRQRGELMSQAREGTMAAVLGLDDLALDAVCREAAAETGQPVVIANYNAPAQLVISGATAAVERAVALAKEHGAKRVRPLNVSAAFHSPLMSNAAWGMERALHDATIAELQIPLIANVSAMPLTDTDGVRRELVAQVVSPVRWVASVQHMMAQGITTFVEIGPGNVLTGLIKRIAPEATLVNLRSIADVQTFLAQHS
jgi:[acyl-carrier-protein] S-malonyltransferase